MLVGTAYNLVHVADYGAPEATPDEIRKCAHELWEKDPSGKFHEQEVKSYLYDIGFSRFQVTAVIVAAHIIAVFLHYANQQMHHFDYKTMANLTMLKKIMTYLWAVASLKNAITFGEKNSLDCSQFAPEKPRYSFGLVEGLDWLHAELIAFQLNIAFEVLLFISAQCKSSKPAVESPEVDCDCQSCQLESQLSAVTAETNEVVAIGHTQLVCTDKYMDATDFSTCQYAGWSQLQYLTGKVFFFTLLCMNLVHTCFMNEYKAHIIFFFSYWGVLFTCISTGLEIAAVFSKKTFQKPAIIVSQMALAFNLTIMPCFWLFMAKDIFGILTWSGMDLVRRIHYTDTHSVPFMTSMYCLFTTRNFKLFPEDWKIIWVSCMVYIFFNWLGGIVEGEPLYPSSYTDWSKPLLSMATYSFFAVFNAVVFYAFAKCWDSFRRV